MKTILILTASLLSIFSARADDDYVTIVKYLGENGHYIISPADVAKVRAYMQAHGYQHVSDIPNGPLLAGHAVTQPTAVKVARPKPAATETEPSSPPTFTNTVVPPVAPVASSTTDSGHVLLIAIIALYFLPLLIAIERRHRQLVPLAILNVAFGWTLIGWIACLAWAFTKRHVSMIMDDYFDRWDAENKSISANSTLEAKKRRDLI